MIRRLHLLLLFFFLAVKVQAQNFQPPIDPKLIVSRTVPVNPDVATLGRYTMSPPSLSNGLPQQDIPLLEIKENGLSYPLGLFYNYSGFRLKEDASSIGLGWGLTDGMIMRIVKHIPDEHDNLMKKFEDFGNNLIEETGPGYIDPAYYISPRRSGATFSYTDNRIFYKLYDAQPDLYIYNFAGYSGKFFWINGEAIQLEHNDIKVSRRTVDNTSGFVLTTPDGVEYQFGEADKTWQTPVPVVTALRCNEGPLETFIGYEYTTSWRVKEITNKTTQSKITFSYGTNFTIHEKNVDQISTVTLAAPLEINDQFFTSDFKKEDVYIKTISKSYFLQEIISDHYKITFITQARSDGGENRIEEIRMYDKHNLGTPVKTIKFDQGYFGNPVSPETCWLKLKGVKIQGGGNNLDYQFSYVNENYTHYLSKAGLNIDHWGYFNNANNFSLVPLTGLLLSQLQNESNLGTWINSWADRTPNFTYSKLFALETTQYPTKGYTKINYESANEKGIRVASLEDFDGEKSTFRYYDYNSNFTIPASYFPTEYYTYIDCGELQRNLTRITTYGSIPDGPEHVYSESDAFYENVMEYFGTPDGQGGRIAYKFQKFFMYGSKAMLIEKTNYKYGSTDFVSQEKSFYSGQSLKTINYWLIPEISALVPPGDPCYYDDPLYRYSCGQRDPDKNYVLLALNGGGTSSVDAAWIRLDSTESILDNVKYVKRFSYKDIDATTGLPKHAFPIKQEENLSNGDIKTTFLYYPGDVDPDNASITLGLPQMWDVNNSAFKNFVSPVIKSKTFINSDLIAKQNSEYSYDAATSNIILTSSETFPTGQESGKVIWTFDYDEKANLISSVKEHEIPKSIVWGYNKLYPIAEVVNATSDRVAYTSFEDGDFGGWSRNAGGTIISNSLITGKKSYSGALSKTVPTGDYFVTLWAKGACSVNNTSGTQLSISKRSSDWRYVEWKLTNVSSVQIVGDNLDEVRLYPVGAQMVTYTYEPLIGMTAKTDINNKTTYFEYDTYGRLSLARDLDYNIVKKYCYNYHGQPEDCSGIINTTPYWQLTGVTRCKPCPQNSSYYTNTLHKKYIDINPNSTSHGVELWLDAGESTACTPLADGQVIAASCQKNNEGKNTGWQEVTYQAMNPCSNLYQTTWIDTIYNSNACPVPPPPPPPPSNCNQDNCSGEGYQCVNDQCEQGYKVITDRFWLAELGMYEIMYHYEFSDGSWSETYSEYE